MPATLLALALLLAPTANPETIQGVVTDPDGAPLAAVTIVVGPLSETPVDVSKTTTDSDGRFALQRHDAALPLVQRSHVLLAYKEGWALSGSAVDVDAPDSLKITLQRPSLRTVKLLDPQGTPLPDARLTLRYARLGDASFYPAVLLHDLATCRTDDEGAATVDLLPEGADLALAVETAELGEQLAYFSGTQTELTLQLRAVGKLVGRVTAPDPTAARDVGITVRSSLPPEPGQTAAPTFGSARTRSDADGRFEIPAIAAGQATISAIIDPKSHFRLTELPTVAIAAGESADVTLALVPGTRVRGEVVDRETSKPVAGAVVYIYNRNGDNHTATTADDGKFEAVVGPGQFWASLREIPPLYLWPIGDTRGGTIEPGTEELTVDPIRMSRGGTVRGSVVNEVGEAVAGAWVTASWTQREDQYSTTGSISTRTDAEGAFVLEPIATDAELSLRSDTKDRASVDDTKLPPGHAEPVRLTISPDGVAPARARIVDSSGKPVTGAKVTIRGGSRTLAGSRRWQHGPEFDNLWELTTDADGRFATPYPLPKLSEHSLLVEAEGMLRHQSSFEPGSSDPAKSLADIVLKRIFRLSGRVVDTAGQPVSGATISTHGSTPYGGLVTTLTGDDGTFAINDGHPDARLVFVSKDGFRMSGAVIPADSQVIELRLERRDEPVAGAPLVTTRPPKEQRAKLLKKLLDPVYEKMLEQPGDYFTREILELLAPYDREHALDHLLDVRTERSRAAVLLKLGEVEDSLQQAAQINDAYSRAYAHLYAADAVNDPARKQEILGEALVHARQEQDPAQRVVLFGNIAERLFDAGERKAAEALIAEALVPASELPTADWAGFARGHFAETLALVDPEEALALVKELKEEDTRTRHYGNIAHELAASDPERAERVLALIPAPSREGYTRRICYRMAAVDLERARKLAAGATEDRERAYAYGVMAMSLREKQPDAARELLREALVKFEQSRRGTEAKWMFPVGAMLLRFAEQVDPPFASEAFWRILAAHPGPQDEFAGWDDAEVRRDAELAKLVLVLALYGREPELCRQIMEPIFERAENWKSGIRDVEAIAAAMMLVDPERAIAWHNRFLPRVDAEHLRYISPVQPWRAMAAMLADSDEDVWKWLQSDVFHLWVIDTEDF